MAEAGKIHSPPPGRQKERPDQRLNVIGTRMLRKEDPRFLIGRGRFVDDIALPNMAHAAVLRSPHAHARIKSIDKSGGAGAARRRRGDHRRGRGEGDRAAAVLRQPAGRAAMHRARQGAPCRRAGGAGRRRYPLHRRRRHRAHQGRIRAAAGRVGHDGCDQFAAATPCSIPSAVPTTSPSIATMCSGRSRQEFAQAAHVVKRHLRWARSGGQPIETCGAVASFDEGSGKFTIYVNSSMYNYIGFTIAAALKVASHQVNHHSGGCRRQLRQQIVPAQGGSASRGWVRARPAARSNISRTGSTTSPPATVTDRTASTTSNWRSMPTTG